MPTDDKPDESWVLLSKDLLDKTAYTRNKKLFILGILGLHVALVGVLLAIAWYVIPASH